MTPMKQGCTGLVTSVLIRPHEAGPYSVVDLLLLWQHYWYGGMVGSERSLVWHCTYNHALMTHFLQSKDVVFAYNLKKKIICNVKFQG